jgi:hypothetical protein
MGSWSLQASGANVTQSFGQALKIYELGQYKQAAKLLNDIVKRYPAHEPSHLLLARIYYKSGVMSRAAWHFKRVSIDAVDGESAYEYGMTFFSRGQCKQAEQALRRVGSSFRGAHLAYFYRAICYSRSKQWYRAEQFFEKAQNLPPHLIGVRRKLLQQVQQSQEREQKHLHNEQLQTQTMTPPPLVLSPPPAEFAMSEKTPKAPKENKPPTKKEPVKVGLTASVAPDLSMNLTSSVTDFNGTQTQHNDSNTIKMGASGTLKNTFVPVSNGDQPYTSLTVSFTQANTDSSGKKVKTQAYEDSPDQTFETITNQPKSSSRVLRFAAAPEIGYPILKSTDLTLGAKFEAIQPQETTSPSATGATGTAGVAISLGALSLGGAAEYGQFQIDDPKTPTTKGFSRMKGSVTPGYNWTNGFYIELNGAYAQYQQVTLAPPGPTAIGDVNSGNALMNGTTFDGNSLEFSGAAGKKFEVAKIKTKGTYTTYTTSNASQFMDGAAEIIKIEGSLEVNFDLGASLVVEGSNQIIGLYRKYVDKPKEASGNNQALTYQNLWMQEDAPKPEKVVANASANQFDASASLKIAPFEGITAKLKIAQNMFDLQVEKKEFESGLLSNTPSSSQAISFEVGFNKTF